MQGNLSLCTLVAPPLKATRLGFSEGHCVFAQMFWFLCYVAEWQSRFLTQGDLWTSFQKSMSISKTKLTANIFLFYIGTFYMLLCCPYLLLPPKSKVNFYCV